MATGRQVVVLVTTNDYLSKSIEKLLNQNGFDPVVTTTVSAALLEAHRRLPSLILVDRIDVGVEGLLHDSLLRNVPLVTLQEPQSVCLEDACIADLTSGADAAICNETYRQVLARIRAILRTQRNTLNPVSSYTIAGIHMDLDRHEVKVHGRAVDLTPKEFNILRQFLESPRRAFSRQELLNRVWGEDYALEEHALDVHIHSLRKKIEANPSHPKLIVTVRGVGYKLRGG